ncbi:hypothetical protein [Acidovorax radicis]|uniref:hypothetical protein n=1 Tax=Acidovorax radicis TaxID=758826 RepID=UPI001CFA74FD|nr:hypothetical protein [Acidovorax radicis]UCV00579.1 hypothetical protein KI609_07435 [Acidovorax radicis]
MAAGWVAALKLVPWGTVIEATPQILQAARKLLGATSKTTAAGSAAGSLDAPSADAATSVTTQLQQLHERVVRLEQEQQDSAVLIQALAEQNAQIVQAVETLRHRNQRLVVAMGVVAVCCLGLLAWALTRPGV